MKRVVGISDAHFEVFFKLMKRIFGTRTRNRLPCMATWIAMASLKRYQQRMS